MWRITSGELYKIITKKNSDDPDAEGVVVPFIPNAEQMELLNNLWHRNIILKARQLGFTTLVSIMWLDHALFNAHQRCGIIAHKKEDAETIFNDKVKFAYKQLPEALKAAMPLSRSTTTTLEFAHNGSTIRVATSVRSGTLHRLHISEFGKICAEYPHKAKEVMTGSIPAVPLDQMLIIESTAEGAEGQFYTLTSKAQELKEMGSRLNQRDYRLHFFAWWQCDDYELEDYDSVFFTDEDLHYFAEVEVEIGQKLSPQKRAWYVATREADYADNPELMWQEYPSTVKEAFQQSTVGCYYAQQLTSARVENRIMKVPLEPTLPVNTFWDIGKSDQTAIWFHQEVAMEHRFFRYYEASGEDLTHFVKVLQDAGHIWGTHYLPHDAAHGRLSDTNRSVQDMLEALGLRNIEIVPRIDNVNTGIQQTRNAFSLCYFDEAGCKLGLQRLQNYRKKWNKTVGAWSDTPLHDDNSNGADAFRQFGQALASGQYNGWSGVKSKRGTRPRRNWKVL